MSALCRPCVIGLDLSLTSAGVSVVENGKLVGTRAIQYKPPRGTKKLDTQLKIERLMFVRNEVLVTLRALGSGAVRAVGIEGYAFSRFSSSVTGLAELGGVMRVALYEAGFIPFILPVTRCRAFMVGDGGADKKKVASFIRERSGLVFETDDECDAYVVAMTTHYLSNPESRSSLDASRVKLLEKIDDSQRGGING